MQKIMCFLEVEPLRGGQPIDPQRKTQHIVVWPSKKNSLMDLVFF